MGTSIDAWPPAEALPVPWAALVAQFESVRGWLAVAGLAVVIGLLLMRAARRQRASRAEGSGWPAMGRRDAGRQPGAGHPPTLSPGAPREAAGWEVEMHEIARELSGQLDSKMRALGTLIAEADRAAARLERALADARPPGSPGGALGGSVEPATHAPPPEVPAPAGSRAGTAPTRDSLAPPVDPRDSAGQRPPAESAPPADGRPSATAPANTEPTPQPDRLPGADVAPTREWLCDEVEMLSMYGYPPAEIARRLDVPIDEVERLLADRASQRGDR